MSDFKIMFKLAIESTKGSH